MYRGFALAYLKRHLRWMWPGVLPATSAFAYCHGGLEHSPYAFTAWFLAGSVFVGLYLWRKSLLPGILTHYLADASLLLM